MLLEKQATMIQSKDAEAFNATVVMFKLRISDIASDSGLTRREIEEFKKGSGRLNTRTISRIILALSPAQRSFYSAMIALQYAAEDAGVKTPILNIQKMDDSTDIYREALKMTFEAFKLPMSRLAENCGIAKSNLSNWLSGKKGFYLESIDKIREALSPQQRNFYNALVETLYIAFVV
jgi:DNA-binding phage protein